MFEATSNLKVVVDIYDLQNLMIPNIIYSHENADHCVRLQVVLCSSSSKSCAYPAGPLQTISLLLNREKKEDKNLSNPRRTMQVLKNKNVDRKIFLENYSVGGRTDRDSLMSLDGNSPSKTIPNTFWKGHIHNLHPSRHSTYI